MSPTPPRTLTGTQQALSAWVSSGKIQGLPDPVSHRVVRPGLAVIVLEKEADLRRWWEQWLAAGTGRVALLQDGQARLTVARHTFLLSSQEQA